MRRRVIISAQACGAQRSLMLFLFKGPSGDRAAADADRSGAVCCGARRPAAGQQAHVGGARAARARTGAAVQPGEHVGRGRGDFCHRHWSYSNSGEADWDRCGK